MEKTAEILTHTTKKNLEYETKKCLTWLLVLGEHMQVKSNKAYCSLQPEAVMRVASPLNQDGRSYVHALF